jgi:hypothetical protein
MDPATKQAVAKAAEEGAKTAGKALVRGRELHHGLD